MKFLEEAVSIFVSFDLKIQRNCESTRIYIFKVLKIYMNFRIDQQSNLLFARFQKSNFNEIVIIYRSESRLSKPGFQIQCLWINIFFILLLFFGLKVPPRPNTYMPFGNGVHSCPGSEMAKLEMLVLLHHLTTTYRFSLSPPLFFV